MTTRAEQIAEAVVSLLKVPALTSCPADDVYRDVLYAIDREVDVALAVEIGDEPGPDTSTLGIAYREVEIRVTAIGKGSSAAALADAPYQEAYGRLMATQQLGGLALRIREGEVRREREAREKPIHAITKTYYIEYRTSENSLEN